MDIKIEIDQAQIDHVNKMLYTMPDKSRAVFRNAINRGLTAARTQGEKEIRKRYLISAGNLQRYKQVTLYGAQQTGSDVVGEISFAGGKIPLYRFRVSPKVRRETNRFVNGRCGWRVTSPVSAGDIRETGMVRREPAFIATFQSGHTGIFYRVSRKTESGKDKLHEYYGPSVADMLDYEEAREAIQERAGEIVSKRLDQELWRVLNGL